MSKMTRLLAVLLVMCLCLGTLTGCPWDEAENSEGPNSSGNPSDSSNPSPTNGPGTPTYTVTEFDPNETYTYKTYFTSLAPNWNPHDYESADSSDILTYLVDGFYTMAFNDELHPMDDPTRTPYDGYVWIPSMAAGDPVDVTAEVKAAHPDWIPADATSGYAWAIPLRDDLYFDTGYHITADTFVQGAKWILDPKLQNYRSTDVYNGSFGIAGAEAYFKAGQIMTEEAYVYEFSDLTLNADGQYETPDGYPVYIAVDYAIEYFDGDTLADYVGAYADVYFSLTHWEDLTDAMDDNGLVPLTEETYPWIQDVIVGNPAWGEDDSYLPNYWVYVTGSYATNPVFEETVGIYAKDEYTLVEVYKSSVAGFTLHYNAMQDSLLLVEPDVYESCLYQDENGVWQSKYMTSVETSPSYGPYSMTVYQTDKMVHYSRNDKWYGYHDDVYNVYMDPDDGQVYRYYQTTDVDIQVIEPETAKQMFLAGELMTYGMQAEDYAEYGFSDYLYASPAASVFFFLLTGDMDGLQAREAAADFDQSKFDLEIITVNAFRRAIAVSFDKQAACDDIYTSNTPAYGIFGQIQIYDPDTAGFYRDTDQAKQALVDFYSINLADYNNDLDAAVAAITGYDPNTAKTLYQQAFEEALDLGYITDNDNDGICDQTIRLYYAATTHSATMLRRIEYLSTAWKRAVEGTPFEGKVAIEADPKIYDSGNGWANAIKNGESDMQLAGWQGSLMDPYSLLSAYTLPEQAYAANWYDTKADMMTLTINGESVTLSVYDWAEAVTGVMVTDTNGVSRSYGENDTTQEVRLTILAAVEGKLLQTYTYIPFLNDGSKFLLTQKAYYVVEEYNPVMGRGGIQYMKYNYTDAEWATYCAEQIAEHGQLQY